MYRSFSILSLLFFSLFISCAQQEAPKVDSQLILRFESALIQRDTSLINANLSADFSISTYSQPGAGQMLQSIVSRASAVSRIELADEELETLEDGKTLARINYFFEKGDSVTGSALVFDKAGKIAYVDYFDSLYQMDRYQPSTLVQELPFEFIDGKIIVSLRLNESDRPLRFLFDTGSDGLAINNELADSLGLSVARRQSAMMVGGNLNIGISSGNTIHLGENAILKNRNIALMNYRNQETDGILGMTLGRDYIVMVDFDKHVLKLYSPGKFEYDESWMLVPVRSTGVALVPSTLVLTEKQTVSGNFIFDTGANFSLVCFENFVRKNRLLVGGWKYESVGNMAGIGHSTTVYHGKAKSFALGDNLIQKDEMPVTLQASNGKSNWDPEEAGSLGIEFIQNYNLVINLVDKVIAFGDRN
ncbi:retropepsin-like aspartic protease [Maribellus sediminis]|uniref:retropepsin-like aspartic protease n=1 Tax=Maribellus sediminis TaxID=2696285 RepID=UPI0014303927|nr:retropepsin-like aspartic protease [Maribellus sediminis]